MRLLGISVLAAGIATSACHGGAASGTTSEAAPPATAAVGSSAPAASKMITVPAGTTLPVVLETTVGSDISHAEEPVRARLAEPVKVDGVTAIPDGSTVAGVVTDATRSGKVKGRAHVALRFDSLSPAGEQEHYPIQTEQVARTAESTVKKDAVKVAAPAVGGAIVGGLIGGGKGAAIGAAAGGGAGTAVVLSTRGKEVHLNRGATLTLRLVEPLTIKVGD